MNLEDAEEYTQALGQVVAGGWRQVALGERLGVPSALGLTTRDWVEQRLGGYVRMSIPERREAVAELTEQGLTTRQAADVLGVDHATVARDRQPEPVADATEEPALLSFEQVEAAPEPEPVADATEEPAPLPQAIKGTGDDEWYTPRWLFDALDVTFSIDVCAPLDRTFSAVPAERHFTIDDDGLAQLWDGTVWCNPPYSKPEPWARRMMHHGDGLLLTHIPMNAGWCVDLWETCDAIRLFQAMEFVRPDGRSQRPGYWLQLAAFGEVATKALSRLQPLGDAAANKRRIASPMWRRAS